MYLCLPEHRQSKQGKPSICTAMTTGWSSHSTQAARTWCSAPCRPTNSSSIPSRCRRTPTTWTMSGNDGRRLSGHHRQTGGETRRHQLRVPRPGRLSERNHRRLSAQLPVVPRRRGAGAVPRIRNSASRYSSTTTATCSPTARRWAAHCPRSTPGSKRWEARSNTKTSSATPSARDSAWAL